MRTLMRLRDEPAVDGHQKGQRAHQVRGQVPQRLALAQRFADEAELEQLEVAQAAVDELRGVRSRAGGEIALVHQGDGESAQGEVARDARSRHAAADDDDVELRVRERLCA